jgi:hypothetical protein
MKNLHLGALFSSFFVLAALSGGCTTNVDGGNGGGNPSGGGTSNGGTSNGGPSNGGTSPSASLDGSYSGTYAGDGSGPVSMTVTGDKVDVVVKVESKSYAGSGDMSGSSIDFGVGTGNGVIVTFAGSFADGKGSGSWRSSIGGKGTWSVAK